MALIVCTSVCADRFLCCLSGWRSPTTWAKVSMKQVALMYSCIVLSRSPPQTYVIFTPYFLSSLIIGYA
jgi:hypothetical protein